MTTRTAILKGDTDADTRAVADLVRAVALPDTTPHLVTLCFDDNARVLARRENLDPTVWDGGIEAALRALAGTMHGHRGMFTDVYGYALVIPEHATAHVVDRYGAQSTVRLGRVPHRNPDIGAGAVRGLRAMLNAGPGLHEPDQCPTQPRALLVGLDHAQTRALREAATASAIRLCHVDSPADARPIWDDATLVITTVAALAGCAKVGLESHRNLVVLVEGPSSLLPPAGIGGYLMPWPDGRGWLTDHLATLAHA